MIIIAIEMHEHFKLVYLFQKSTMANVARVCGPFKIIVNVCLWEINEDDYAKQTRTSIWERRREVERGSSHSLHLFLQYSLASAYT